MVISQPLRAHGVGGQDVDDLVKVGVERMTNQISWLSTNPSSPGRPEESHLKSPTDPYVSLSTHTARASLPLEASQPQADIER